jgi:hypothetical protein
MSRYQKTTETETLVYGYDHALGYFYELWENYNTEEEKCKVDKCSIFGMKKSEMAQIMTEKKVKKSHLMAIALDIPF